MYANGTQDPENGLLPSETDGNAQKRFGRSFKQFDLKHLRQVGIENLPKEVRIPAFSSVVKSSTKNSNKPGRSVFL